MAKDLSAGRIFDKFKAQQSRITLSSKVGLAFALPAGLAGCANIGSINGVPVNQPITLSTQDGGS